MTFKSSRTAYFGNGYSVEFLVTDPYIITFNIITEKDHTLIDNTSVCVGTDYCLRDENSEESLRDFAVRARLEGIAFAEECIAEHKVALDLSSILDEVLEPDLK